jgi:hypothetical protein
MIVHKVVDAQELERLTSLTEEPWELVHELSQNSGPVFHPLSGYSSVMPGPRFLVRRGETAGFSKMEERLRESQDAEKRLKEELGTLNNRYNTLGMQLRSALEELRKKDKKRR